MKKKKKSKMRPCVQEKASVVQPHKIIHQTPLLKYVTSSLGTLSLGTYPLA